MKLCFVSPGQYSVDVLKGDTSESGGAEAQIAYLATAFADLGHQVDLIYGDGDSKATVRAIAGVRCVDAFPAWRHPGSLRVFWRALAQSGADLIYTRLPHDFVWLAGLFAKCSPNTTFVYALASDRQCNPWRTYSHKGWLHNSLYALGLRTAGVVAAQHEAQAQSVRRYANGKLVLIPNLVRLVAPEVRSIKETDIDVIWIAQIRPLKQLSVLLDMAEELPHLRFVVVGGFSGTDGRSALEHRMQSLGNVSYVGPVDHEGVMRLLVHSKVLANTSRWEGFPNTMLEAWSLGVPVVSLKVDPGGIISREGLGLVSGTPGQMVLDIVKLVEEHSLNYELGKKGQEYVRRAHSTEAVSRAFEQIVPAFRARNDAARKGVV